MPTFSIANFLVEFALKQAYDLLPRFHASIEAATNLRGEHKPTIEVYEPTSVGASIKDEQNQQEHAALVSSDDEDEYEDEDEDDDDDNGDDNDEDEDEDENAAQNFNENDDAVDE